MAPVLPLRRAHFAKRVAGPAQLDQFKKNVMSVLKMIKEPDGKAVLVVKD